MTRLQLDLTIHFPDFELDVTYDAAIHVLAVTGRSGIGKTSLLNAIAGLIRPTRGRIVLGDTVLSDSERQIHVPPHQRNIGYVFQDARLFPHLSVARNLDYAAFLARRREPIIDRAHLIELMGLGDLLERYPQTLSGGERQRAAIARALLSAPRLILLDEPISAIDRQRGRIILDMLQNLKTEISVPMILVSHNMDDIAALSDSNLNLEPAGEKVAAR